VKAGAKKLAAVVLKQSGAYQKIRLAAGVSTQGVDRSATATLIFPNALNGKSILDIGCHIGYFCCQAAKKGSTDITGIDLDPKHTDSAKRIATFLGHEIKYKTADMDKVLSLKKKYNYILMLNVLHHIDDPIRALDIARRHCLTRIIVEFPDVRCKEFGVPKKIKNEMSKYPVIGLAEKPRQPKEVAYKYLFTKSSMKKLCTEIVKFKNVHIVPSPFKVYRHIAFLDV